MIAGAGGDGSMMSVTLEVLSGPDSGRTLTRPARGLCQIGRSSWADLTIAGDRNLEDLHALLECGSEGVHLRDLGSRSGTFVNGRRVVGRTLLRDGDQIRAGDTTILVQFAVEAGSPARPPGQRSVEVPAPITEAAPSEAESVDGVPGRLAELLRSSPGTLYALLDAARTPEVLGLLLTSGLQYQSLYEGEKGELLGAVAPYLVEIPREYALRESPPATRGWGQSWGVYLTSDRPFAEIRKHFRHFLQVELGEGKRVYFRFYDPRVLRVYLPTCTPVEVREFFGPVRAFLMEAGSGESLLEFSAESGLLRVEERSLRERARRSEA